MDVLVTVFCAPVTTTVHIVNTETGGCYNPLGANISCECKPGAPSIAVPMAFVNVTTSMLRPGLLRFCSALPLDVERVSEGLVGTLSLVSALSGSSAAQLQGMEILSSFYCDDETQRRRVSPSVVPLYIGGSVASGLAGLTIIVAGVGVLQGLAVVVTGLLSRYVTTCSVEGSDSLSGALQTMAGRLKCPAVTALVGQLAVAGTALESLWILLGSDEEHERGTLMRVAGTGGLLAIVAFWGLVCMCGVKCSKAMVNNVYPYEAVHSPYPTCVRRALPSFYYKCMHSPWCYWSLVFGTYQRRRLFVECVDMSVTAVVLGAVASTRDAVCRGMMLTASGLFFISACVLFGLNTYRRPVDRLCTCAMKVLNCLLACRQALPHLLGWLPPLWCHMGWWRWCC